MRLPVQQVSKAISARRNWLAGVVAAVAVYALLGFLVLPWAVRTTAIDWVHENLGAELRLAEVATNPFVLSLRIDGLELDDPTGQPFARVGGIFANFQLSSLFRRAWTFDEFRIDSPQFNLARDGEGTLNVARFAEQMPPPAEPETGSGPPRLLIFDFAMTEGVVQWHDAIPPEPVETVFGPVSVAVQQLNTLPDRAGQQAVVVRTETAGTLSWEGTLQLNPLQSAGHAAITGPHFPLISAYVRHDLGFDLVEGETDVELDYSISAAADDGIAATVDNFRLALRDVLVRTFTPPEPDAVSPPERDVLSLPAMRLDGGTLRWPEQSVTLESIEIDDAVVSLLRDAAGRIEGMAASAGPAEGDVAGAAEAVEAAAETAAEPEAAADAETEAGGNAPWNLSLARFNVNRLELMVEDQGVQPHAIVGVRNLNLGITDLSTAPDAKFPTTLDLEFRDGGDMSVTGEITVLPAPLFELDAKIAGAELAAVQAYINAFADIHVASGALNVDGHLSHSIDEPLSFKGNVELVDLDVTEGDDGPRLAGGASLRADNVAFSAAAESLEISAIALDKPYGDIRIARDGSVNLGRLGKGEPGAVPAAASNDVASGNERGGDERAGDLAGAIEVTVGRVVITDGAADFEDLSLPLPFAVTIGSLDGNVTTIATTSSEPSTVTLEGKVDEYGMVRITGSATPLDPVLDTDINVVFRNVEIPKFSAYSVPLAGREIASGRLDLDLGYRLVDSRLVGDNRIVLRDFELGRRVEHPDAMSLPLGLAVALLKGPDGVIDIDLPVSGNVDDPEFGYGTLVWKALTNLIVRIAASPFTLLANLVGVEAGDLEYIVFAAGRSELSPPEQEKIAKLAEALELRPQLALQVPGVIDREADGLALRTMKLDQAVEQRIAKEAGDGGDKDGGDKDGGDQAMYAERRREILEAMYIDRAASEDPRELLEQLRTEYTTPADPAEGRKARERFDAPAYAGELRRRLIEYQPLEEAELDALAAARANTTQAAILAINPALRPRVGLPDTTDVDAEDDDIRMKVVLTAGAADEARTAE